MNTYFLIYWGLCSVIWAVGGTWLACRNFAEDAAKTKAEYMEKGKYDNRSPILDLLVFLTQMLCVIVLIFLDRKSVV